jgi:hypothetical protein
MKVKKKKVAPKEKKKITRLYRRKNARVKKALSFSTSNDKKLA